MSHEHHGNCCGQAHEHIVIEQLQQASHFAGQLCCSGMCSHPEHQPGASMQEFHARLAAEAQDEDDNKTKKKKKKRTTFTSYGNNFASLELII